jgi:uncharacterized RDD family membrane protein YckC
MSQYPSSTPEPSYNLWAAPDPSAASPSAPAAPLPAAPQTYVSASAPVGRQWPFASWGARVGASLIDSLLVMVGAIPYAIGFVMILANTPPPATDGGSTVAYSATTTDPTMVLAGTLLIFVGGLLMLGIWLWNRVFKMGRTGQSVGKGVMRQYLVSERTGNPIGAGMCFVRELCHYVDGILYLGYLWPIWDPKRQTFSDKIVGTVVAQAPHAEF